jgi:hypothetical protein
VTLTLTFRYLPTLESQFSQTLQHKAIFWSKGDSEGHIAELMKFR